jgi:hypothetical protein
MSHLSLEVIETDAICSANFSQPILFSWLPRL